MCPMNVFDIEDFGSEMGAKKTGKGTKSKAPGECKTHVFILGFVVSGICVIWVI